MEELLNSVIVRVSKIDEISEKIKEILNQGAKDSQNPNITSSRIEVYDQIRKMKEEEKNRIDKENWIVNIMRNIRSLTQEQQNHIYIKTYEIMKVSSKDKINVCLPIMDGIQQFLDEYMKLFETFCQMIGQDLSLKMPIRLGAKHGNISTVTELLKFLLQISRNDFKKMIEQYSGFASPEKDKKIFMMKKVVERSRSFTQKKNQENVEHMEARTMKPRKELRDFLGTPINDQENKLLYQRVATNSSKELNELRTQPQPYFTYIKEIMDDLEDNFINLLEYQSQKRVNMTKDEIKLNYDSLLERSRQRNFSTNATCQRYRLYLMPYWKFYQSTTEGERDAAGNIRRAFEKLNKLPRIHLCLITLRPRAGYMCLCLDPCFCFKIPGSVQEKQIFNSGSKGFIVRKHLTNNNNTTTKKVAMTIQDLRNSVMLSSCSTKVQEVKQNRLIQYGPYGYTVEIKLKEKRNSQDTNKTIRSTSANLRYNVNFSNNLYMGMNQSNFNQKDQKIQLRSSTESQNTNGFRARVYMKNSLQQKYQKQQIY